MQLPIVGATVQLRYPTCTDVLAKSEKRWKPRQIEVLGIRDLVTQPLTPQEFMRRPFTRRTRYLIKGRENGILKQFYLGTSLEFHTAGQLRLALYRPGALRPEELLARPFENEPYDRRLLYQSLLQLAEYDFGHLQLRVLADDLRLVCC